MVPMNRPRTSYPEAWIGKMVEMHNSPHSHGRLVDVNAFGITYEADGDPDRLRFAPWGQIGTIGRRSREARG